MPSNHDKLESILLAALDISDETQRQNYIEKSCGSDSELRGRIESLIDNHFRAGRFLESPAESPFSNSGERSGDMIGPYLLLEQIGEGGFGTVFKAKQESPIRRIVALKVIKQGMDTSQVAARFENERQALAMMEHPSIARVLDGGQTASGRPYFVMELVHGIPITDYCDLNHLTTRQRLELMVSVCQAVQHAHQKGIIHRDIKPSNILVTEVDDRAIPKVIDFGVAKAVRLNLLDISLDTNVATIVGTPQYMSPEQANSQHEDVDTRTDIYSLGILLYELLTGSPPFDRRTFANAGIVEMLRVIREVDPPTPVSKLKSSDSLPSIAANRSIEPSKLATLLRRDIEWIVMKCLEKDRSRRYETANGLARDVERFLNDEPVEAGPPDSLYRIRKFLNRNRRSVAAATAILVSLVGGIIGTSIGLVRAERGQQAALLEQQNADRQRQRAERHYQRALDAVDRMLVRVGESELVPVPLMDNTRLRLLEDALEFYRGFLSEEGDEPTVLRDTGRAHGRIARLQVALGRINEAERSCTDAVNIQERLVNDFPENSEYRMDLIKTRRQLAIVWHLDGRSQDAENLLKQGLDEVWLDSAAARSEQVEYQFLLGSVSHDTSQPKNAETAFMSSIESVDRLLDEDPNDEDYQELKARILNRLGLVLRETQRLKESQQSYTAACDILRKLIAIDSTEPAYGSSLAATLNNLGSVCMAQMLLPEAEKAYSESLESMSELVKHHPGIVTYQEFLAKIHNNLGLYFSRCDNPVRAAQENEKAMIIHEELMTRFPKMIGFTFNFAGGCGNQAKYLLEQEKWDEALLWYTRSIDAIGPVLNLDPRNAYARSILHSSHLGRARAFKVLNRTSEALSDYRRTLELSEGEQHSNYVNYRPRALAHLGEYVQATNEAEAIIGKGNCLASTYLELASVFGQCSGTVQSDSTREDAARSELSDQYAARAISLLVLANENGYFSNADRIADLSTDERLEPIFERDSFKDFLKDLQQDKEVQHN